MRPSVGAPFLLKPSHERLSIGRFVRPPVQAKFARGGNRASGQLSAPTLPCKDRQGAARLEFSIAVMARDPKIAYVLLRNAHFGPRLAASVELCVRDLVLHSRYGRSTLVVCPPVDRPF